VFKVWRAASITDNRLFARTQPMMISPTGASDVYAAAAALDRQLRSSSDDAGDATSGSAPGDSGPDVIVTFSQGASTPATYDASGKLPGAPALDELGADKPDSLARATEALADDADAGASDATTGSDAAPDLTPEAVAAAA
jgi:hypothetical protein